MATSVVLAVLAPLLGSSVTGVRLQVRSLVYTSAATQGRSELSAKAQVAGIKVGTGKASSIMLPPSASLSETCSLKFETCFASALVEPPPLVRKYWPGSCSRQQKVTLTYF